LRLAQLQPEGHQPGHLARERFENLGGTDHYASELLRAYQAFPSVVGQVRFIYQNHGLVG
jgi:hypothetical protein